MEADAPVDFLAGLEADALLPLPLTLAELLPEADAPRDLLLGGLEAPPDISPRAAILSSNYTNTHNYNEIRVGMKRYMYYQFLLLLLGLLGILV